MAIVLGLMIVGWLVAFALGSQAGFDVEPAPSPQTSVSVTTESSTYRDTVSAS